MWNNSLNLMSVVLSLPLINMKNMMKKIALLHEIAVMTTVLNHIRPILAINTLY